MLLLVLIGCASWLCILTKVFPMSTQNTCFRGEILSCTPGVGQLPSRKVQGCTGIPGVFQLPSRTVQGSTFIPVVGQLPSRTVQGCTGIPGIWQLPN